VREAAAELEAAEITGPAPDFADLLLDVGDVLFRYVVDLVLAVLTFLCLPYLAFLFSFPFSIAFRFFLCWFPSALLFPFIILPRALLGVLLLFCCVAVFWVGIGQAEYTLISFLHGRDNLWRSRGDVHRMTDPVASTGCKVLVDISKWHVIVLCCHVMKGCMRNNTALLRANQSRHVSALAAMWFCDGLITRFYLGRDTSCIGCWCVLGYADTGIGKAGLV
jgi:hypothetical protein